MIPWSLFLPVVLLFRPPVIHLLFEAESRNFNGLVLIFFRPARAGVSAAALRAPVGCIADGGALSCRR
jgi:hypothetical protein